MRGRSSEEKVKSQRRSIGGRSKTKQEVMGNWVGKNGASRSIPSEVQKYSNKKEA